MTTNYSDLVKQRRSIRKYKDDLIKPEDLEQILRAGLMAPTSKRSQAWEFIVVEEKAMLKALSQSKAQGSAFLANAPIAVVVLAHDTKSDVWIEDASIAAIMMQLQAEALGLGSCWIQIRNRENAEGESAGQVVKELLRIPDEYQPLCILSFGYKAEEKASFDESKLKWEKIHLNYFTQE